MNPSIHKHPAAAIKLDALPPERWVVATAQSPTEAQHALLQPNATTGAQPSQLLQWRLRHDLVKFANGPDLHAAVVQALQTGAPRVHVRNGLSAADCNAALRSGFSAEQTHRLNVRSADVNGYPGLAEELAEPDSEVLGRWLLLGRQIVPALAPADAPAACLAEHAAAFQQWAAVYLQHADEDLLDEMFVVDHEPEVTTAPALAVADETPTLLQTMVSFVRGVLRPADDWWSAGAMGAAGIEQDATQVLAEWNLLAPGRKQDVTGTVKLCAPFAVDALGSMEGNQTIDGLELQLRLRVKDWGQRPGLFLTLHPAGHHLPVRVAVAGWPLRTAPAGPHASVTLPLPSMSAAALRGLGKGALELEFRPVPVGGESPSH